VGARGRQRTSPQQGTITFDERYWIPAQYAQLIRTGATILTATDLNPDAGTPVLARTPLSPSPAGAAWRSWPGRPPAPRSRR